MPAIIDTTLREGEQAAYVYFDMACKLRIVEFLSTIGVEEIELGIGVKNPEIEKLIRKVREKTSIPIALWSRCTPGDIDQTLSLAPDVISLSVPVSSVHLKKRLGIGPLKLKEYLKKGVCRVRSRAPNIYISIGIEDASRADPDFVLEVCEVAKENGVHRVRFSDTLGTMSPLETYATVKLIKRHCDLALALHCHNDFGMATANAISALQAGADFVDVSVCGLGDRAGIAALEEVVAFMVKRMGQDSYRLKNLKRLCHIVCEAACLPLYPKKPIVGEEIFFCESGLHIDGLLKSSDNYEPFNPSELGHMRRILIGKKAGRKALLTKLRELDLDMPDAKLDGALIEIKKASSVLNRCLTDDEIKRIVRALEVLK